MKPKPIPDGFHAITPYLAVDGAARLIDFILQAFDGTVTERLPRPDGKVGHASVKIGDSFLMLADACGEMKAVPVGLYLYVEDADATYRRALQAGGISLKEPTDEFYGDRVSGVKDPAGNTWWIATHIEDIPSEELHRRAEARMKKTAGS